MSLYTSVVNLFFLFLFMIPTLGLLMFRSRGVMARNAQELTKREDLDIDAFETARDAYNRRAQLRLGIVFGSTGLFVLWAVIAAIRSTGHDDMFGVMLVGMLLVGAWACLGLPFVLHDMDKMRYVNGHETNYVYANGHYGSERSPHT